MTDSGSDINESTGRPSDRERWNARYRSRAEFGGPPLALEALAHLFPTTGLAVDLAGGDGAGAQFLAERGLSPVMVEVSDVALDRANARTTAGGLQLETVDYDLSRSGLAEVLVAATGDRPVAVVTCFHYLQRDLLASVALDLPPGAVFACAIATTTNLERNQRPSRRFLVEPGELGRLVLGGDGQQPADIEVLHSSETWNRRDQHEAVLAIRRID